MGRSIFAILDSLFLVMADHGLRITCAVRDMQDDDFGIRKALINGVISKEVGTQTK